MRTITAALTAVVALSVPSQVAALPRHERPVALDRVAQAAERTVHRVEHAAERLADARQQAAERAQEARAALPAVVDRPALSRQHTGTGSVPHEAMWMAIAACESSGRWDLPHAPYSGGLQYAHATWVAYGGLEFAAHAHLATPTEQMIVAERVAFTGWEGTPPQGLGAWPTCAAPYR